MDHAEHLQTVRNTQRTRRLVRESLRVFSDLRWRLAAFSWCLFICVQVVSLGALITEQDVTCTDGGGGGRTLKNWLTVAFVSASLHAIISLLLIVCRRLEQFREEWRSHIVQAMLRGLREINLALLVLWYTLGNLWLIQASPCSEQIPFTFAACALSTVMADLRVIVPATGRCAVVLCPDFTLSCLRYFLGSAGIMWDEVDIRNLVGQSGDMHSDGPPSDGEIATWVCWLVERGCIVERFKLTLTLTLDPRP